MTSTMFSLEAFDPVGVRENPGSNNELDDVVWGTNGSKHNNYRGEYRRDSSFPETLNSKFDFYQDSSLESDFVFAKYQQQYHQDDPLPAHDLLDDLNFNIDSSSLQMGLKEMANLVSDTIGVQHSEDEKKKQHPFSLTSLDLLKSYEHRLKKLDGDKIVVPSSDTTLNGLAEPSLSTEEIIKLAGVKFIQTTSSVGDPLMTSGHPYGSSFSGLPVQ